MDRPALIQEALSRPCGNCGGEGIVCGNCKTNAGCACQFGMGAPIACPDCGGKKRRPDAVLVKLLAEELHTANDESERLRTVAVRAFCGCTAIDCLTHGAYDSGDVDDAAAVRSGAKLRRRPA